MTKVGGVDNSFEEACHTGDTLAEVLTEYIQIKTSDTSR